jgi:hypothetical protein
VPPASNELAQRVSQLEAEILLLRRMLNRLKRKIESVGAWDERLLT